jgi:hypothetical protein
MRFTAILQALKTITWRYTTHHARDGRRTEAEALIRDHYNQRRLEARDVEHAIVKYTPHLQTSTYYVQRT